MAGVQRLPSDKGEFQDLDDVDEDTDDLETKQRRILAETRHLDADSDGGGDSDASSEEDESEDEDDGEVLLRELEKIKKERAEQREKRRQP